MTHVDHASLVIRATKAAARELGFCRPIYKLGLCRPVNDCDRSRAFDAALTATLTANHPATLASRTAYAVAREATNLAIAQLESP